MLLYYTKSGHKKQLFIHKNIDIDINKDIT